MINPVVHDQLLEQAIDQRKVCARLRCQVDLSSLGNRRLARVDRDEMGRVRSGQPIQDP